MKKKLESNRKEMEMLRKRILSKDMYNARQLLVSETIMCHGIRLEVEINEAMHFLNSFKSFFKTKRKRKILEQYCNQN
jgi:hypothetical protein